MDDFLNDVPAEISVSPSELLAEGQRRYERFHAVLTRPGEAPLAFTCDLVRGGTVVGALAFDPALREIVLIRQFRLAAHLATGKGDMVEIVAGGIKAGEEAAQAADRECMEEIGVAPTRLVELYRFLPTADVTDEHFTLFLAIVDASRVPERAGIADEAEDTRPMKVPLDWLVAAFPHMNCGSGFTIIALQWLMLNRDKLERL